MKVTIFNLLSDQEPDVKALEQTYIDDFNLDLSRDDIEVFDVDATKVKDCIGCWSCWIKTPGVCVFSDIMPEIYTRILASDVVLFMLPVQQGFIEGSAKTFIDRLIPLYHPYIYIHRGEMMHQDRYKKYPHFEFYFEQEDLNDIDDQVIEDYVFRTCYHFRQEGVRFTQNNQGLWSRKKLLDRKPQADENIESIIDSSGEKFIIYNGSPRGKRGNSLKIIHQICLGMQQAGIDEKQIEIRHLVDQNQHKGWANDFYNTPHHLFVFPLYVHSMPGIVKKYFDVIVPTKAANKQQPQMSFFVQSGFSGAYQSEFLRAYLCRLPNRLKCLYGGTLIKGGMEGLQVQPDSANQKLYKMLQQMGKSYVFEGRIAAASLNELGSASFISALHKAIYFILRPTGIMNLYWNIQLKKNMAFSKRFDRPYE